MDKQLEKKLHSSQQEEPAILVVIRQMMFVYGDEEFPIKTCEQFVLDLVKHQVLLVTNEAWGVAQEKKVSEIRVKDLVFVMRNHIDFLLRLLRYAQAGQKIAELTREADEEENGKTKKMEGAFTRLMDAIKELELNISEEMIEKQQDTYLEQRQKRMLLRINQLEIKQYGRFADARKANFCSSTKKGTRRPRDPFITWLGNPPLARYADLVLAFIARETIASLTDDAATLRAQEPKGFFTDEGLNDSIQLRHYEQALRRNLNFRRNGNYLFGIAR